MVANPYIGRLLEATRHGWKGKRAIPISNKTSINRIRVPKYVRATQIAEERPYLSNIRIQYLETGSLAIVLLPCIQLLPQLFNHLLRISSIPELGISGYASNPMADDLIHLLISSSNQSTFPE